MRLNSLATVNPSPAGSEMSQNDQVGFALDGAADTCSASFAILVHSLPISSGSKAPRYIHIIFNDQHFSRPGLAVLGSRLKTGKFCGNPNVPNSPGRI